MAIQSNLEKLQASKLREVLEGGTLTRRQLMKRAALLGLGVPVVAGLLAACAEDDAVDDPVEPDDDDTATPVDDTDDEDDEDEEPVDEPDVDAEEPPVGDGGQAIVTGLGDPGTLLSGASTLAVEGFIYSFIANGLVKLRQPDLEVVEDLATEWEISEDGRTYDFYLRDDATWHDGEPVTGADALFTYSTWAHPDWPGALPANVPLIEGLVAFNEGEAEEISGIQLVDDFHVQITLIEASPVFLATAATAKLLPEHVLEDVSPADLQQDDFARAPIYSGPFQLEEWRAGESLIFRANDDFFGGRPNLDSVVSRHIPDPATALAELRSGEVQMMPSVPADQFAEFEESDTYQTYNLSGTAGWFLQFDLTNPLFEDIRVRQAISHAIDRQAIIDALFQGNADLNQSILSPVSWLYNPDVANFNEFDPDLSRELLDEAGWEEGPDGIRTRDDLQLNFELLVTAISQEWAIAIQPFLEDIGVHFTVQVLETATWTSQLSSRDYEGTISGWFNFILDPRMDFRNHYQSPRPRPDSTGYQNDEVDELLAQAAEAVDPDEELDLYMRAQEIVAEDLVYVYLWRPNNLVAVREGLNIPTVDTVPQLWASMPDWSVD